MIKESTDTWNMKYERQQGPGKLFLDLPTKIDSKGRLVLFLQMPLYFFCVKNSLKFPT